MLKYLILVLALTLPLACQQQGEQTGTTEETPAVDVAAIEAAIRADGDAYEQHSLAGDVEGLVSHYSDDAIMSPPGMPKAEGTDAIRSAYTQMYAAGNPSSAELNTERVIVSETGDLAVEVGSFRFEGPGPDGSTVTDNGKYLAVWKPTADGTWKIAADIWNADAPAGEAVSGTGGAETTTE
jgi:ketosteroid isomerase-like protein